MLLRSFLWIAKFVENIHVLLANDDADEVSFRKLLEAVDDAAFRGLPLVEATEIYSGFDGIMN